MQLNHYWKILAIGIAALLIQACASSPSAPEQKSNDHIKTEIPAPFPITVESLRKEREIERAKTSEQNLTQ